MNPRRFRGSSAWALTLLVAFAGAPRVAGAQTPPAPAAESPRTALLPEPGFITRGIDFATRTIGDGSGDKSGFYPDLADMISGAGWISAGPGYRQWINGDRIFFDASAAISWRAYKTARTRLEFTNLARSRVAIGGEIKWQDYTQVSYFGEGPESLEANRSEYRVRSTDSVGYANLKPVKWLTLGARAGWLYRPELMERAGPFTRGFPDMREVFPDDPAFALSEQPSYLHGELFVTADTRDQRSHPVRGGVYRTGWSRYWDRDAGTFSFQRVEAEAAQFIPVADSRLTIALHGWVAASDTAEGAEYLSTCCPPSAAATRYVCTRTTASTIGISLSSMPRRAWRCSSISISPCLARAAMSQRDWPTSISITPPSGSACGCTRCVRHSRVSTSRTGAKAGE